MRVLCRLLWLVLICVPFLGYADQQKCDCSHGTCSCPTNSCTTGGSPCQCVIDASNGGVSNMPFTLCPSGNCNDHSQDYLCPNGNCVISQLPFTVSGNRYSSLPVSGVTSLVSFPPISCGTGQVCNNGQCCAPKCQCAGGTCLNESCTDQNCNTSCAGTEQGSLSISCTPTTVAVGGTVICTVTDQGCVFSGYWMVNGSHWTACDSSGWTCQFNNIPYVSNGYTVQGFGQDAFNNSVWSNAIQVQTSQPLCPGDSSCAGWTCQGSTCQDFCGQTYNGTKTGQWSGWNAQGQASFFGSTWDIWTRSCNGGCSCSRGCGSSNFGGVPYVYVLNNNYVGFLSTHYGAFAYGTEKALLQSNCPS